MPIPSPRLARISGYVLVAGALAAGASFAAFALREFRDPGTLVRVRFPAVSTLSEGDPVVESGVETGRVERIVLDPDGSAVAELRLHRRRLPARDARFVNFSHSLMGARKVWIEAGASPLPLDPSSVREGVFVPGLPEVLHRVRELGEHIAAWDETFDRLLGGGDAAAVLRVAGDLEKALARAAALEVTLQAAAGDLRTGVEGLTAFGNAAEAAAGTADAGIAGTAKAAASAGPLLVGLETELASSLSRLETITALLDADTGLAGRLLANRALYDSLVGGVNKLATLARAYRQEGLGDSLKIRPRFPRREGR